MSAVNELDRQTEMSLLRDSVRDSVASHFVGLPDTGWQDEWRDSWSVLDGQGLWSTIQPPDGSLAMAVVVAEELGRALYPGPAVETLTGAYLLSVLGLEEPAAAFVSADAGGDPNPMVAIADDTLLLVAGGGALTAVRAGDTTTHAVPSLDVTRRTVVVRPPDRTTLRTDHDIARLGCASRSLLYLADTIGCVDTVLTKTTAYAMQRNTFGAPIGKYQAVAHRLVDHAVALRQMRLLVDTAVAAFDHGTEDLGLHLATAETFFWGRGQAIVSDCIQLCGGIGFTWEWGHHFYLRRAVQNTVLGSGYGRPHARLSEEAGW